MPTGDDRSQVSRAGRAAAAPYRGGPHRTRARSAMPSQRAHVVLPILVDHRRATARPLTGRKPRASALTRAGRPGQGRTLPRSCPDTVAASTNRAIVQRQEGCRLFGGACRFGGCPFVSWSTIPEKEGTMQYVLLIYHGTSLTTSLPEDEQKRIYAEWAEVNKTPGLTGGVPLGLPENATTVRVQDGKTLTTDGPFVELKEAVGGYLVFEADDLDAAIELAARIPAARLGGAIEVRPIVEW